MGTRVEAIDKEYIDDAIVFDFKGAPDVPAELVSEGTLLVLALLTALLNPARPRLLLIDDLDRGLHPKAQRELIPMIRAILDQNRDLQIIATTHSPYIVDELDPTEIRVTWAGEDGVHDVPPRLDEHPDLAPLGRMRCGPASSGASSGSDGWPMAKVRSGNDGGNTRGRVRGAPRPISAHHPRLARPRPLRHHRLAGSPKSSTIARCFEGLSHDQPFVTWVEVKSLSRELGIRPRGFIENESGQPEPRALDARQTQRVIHLIESRWPEVGGILLIRDDDRKTKRRTGMEQARGESALSARIVIGLAHTKRECWVLAGFEPGNDDEELSLSNASKELGFDPRLHADRLTAKHDHDKRSAKGILRDLVRDDAGREAKCWKLTPLSLLKQRGTKTGLAEYLDEVEILGKSLFQKESSPGSR